MKKNAILVSTVVLLSGIMFGTALNACETCDSTGILGHLAYNAFCRAVGPDEVGSTRCELSYDPLTPSVDCFESGTFCSTIVVTGGGGDGGAGGGGCTGGGFCPASCFSCGGGGGRPRI